MKSEKLCVLICDNSDQASQVDFNQFLNLSVRYFHNDSNIGLLGNLKRLIALSHADYIWILSDDDQVKVSELPVVQRRSRSCLPVPRRRRRNQNVE